MSIDGIQCELWSNDVGSANGLDLSQKDCELEDAPIASEEGKKDKEMDKEERYWEQHARVNWLKNGDKNTSFFQKFTSQRRHTNRIRGLKRSDGLIATDRIEIGEITRDYFSDLFDSRGIDNLDHILSGVSCCINDSMNQSLTSTYSKEENKEALKGMGPTKASGSNGFPIVFYQKY
ncbi:hypothetical protein J1N35_037645 [Gossypium stocksii]|uniref:Uncharacterized protein n=1 Tax=Gossypium stocksii TaxID=47602 RepID=A0A9D3ZL45_9ROSI|nr:hypothetical protein J1N35_037645 [Gossypium stocksii]